MSRNLSNPKLKILMRKKTRQLADMGLMLINGFTFGDLCDYAKTSQQALHLYFTERKDCPKAEARMAAVFGISTKELRWRLGLPARKDGKQVKITGRQNKYGAFISVRAVGTTADRRVSTDTHAAESVRTNNLCGVVPTGGAADKPVARIQQGAGLPERRGEVLHRGDAEEFIARPEKPAMNGYNQLDRSNNMLFLTSLIAALIVVESNGDPRAVGDGGRAVGILQIKDICVRDVNRIYGTDYEWPRDAYNSETAREICRLYLKHYLKFVQNPSPSDAARIWNGGPHGYLKRDTIVYWQRVQPLYAQACTCKAQGIAHIPPASKLPKKG